MSKVKLHFGHVTIRLFLCDIGDSLERPLLKHGLSSFKYISRQNGIFKEPLEKDFKEQHTINLSL